MCSLVPPAIWGYKEKATTWKTILSWPCWHLNLRLPATRTVSNEFVVYKLPSLLFFSYSSSEQTKRSGLTRWVIVRQGVVVYLRRPGTARLSYYICIHLTVFYQHWMFNTTSSFLDKRQICGSYNPLSCSNLYMRVDFPELFEMVSKEDSHRNRVNVFHGPL